MVQLSNSIRVHVLITVVENHVYMHGTSMYMYNYTFPSRIPRKVHVRKLALECIDNNCMAFSDAGVAAFVHLAY